MHLQLTFCSLEDLFSSLPKQSPSSTFLMYVFQLPLYCPSFLPHPLDFQQFIYNQTRYPAEVALVQNGIIITKAFHLSLCLSTPKQHLAAIEHHHIVFMPTMIPLFSSSYWSTPTYWPFYFHIFILSFFNTGLPPSL